MKNAVIYVTNTGTTRGVAEYIKNNLPDTDIYDFAEYPNVDLGSYGNIIFGTNIRMFMINGNFKRAYRKHKKQLFSKNVYCYFSACNFESVGKYKERIAKRVKQAKKIIHIGAELKPENASSKFDKQVIQDVLNDFKAKGKAEPTINYESVDSLIDAIKRNDAELMQAADKNILEEL